jgi:D-glycero-D-manno-heptose 1,7-bisphosphate phosphatase
MATLKENAQRITKRAVFLDRDGTINEEVQYLGRVEDFHLLPGAAEGIRLLNERGWVAVVITNQAGIGRGYYTVADMQAIHARMRAELAEAGASIDAIYYCPHHPNDACACRKPLPGMYEQAARELNLDLAASYAVGDKQSDLQPGRQLGCRTILVLTGYGPQHLEQMRQSGAGPDLVARDLLQAAQQIVGGA